MHFLHSVEQADNVVEGSIGDIILCGQTTQFHLDVPGERRITITSLINDVSGTIGVGSRVRVGWPRDATTLLKLDELST